MATANESQGLKIVVAIFVSLTVILAVTSYFLYSEYSKASEQLALATTKASEADRAASQANANLLAIKERAGYGSLSGDTDAILKKADEDQQTVLETIRNNLNEANQAISQAQQDGATGPEVERYRATLTNLIQAFADESTNPTFLGTIQTLTSLTTNQAGLSTALATENIRLRRQLENVDNVNQAELVAQQQAAQQAQADLQNEHQKYEDLFNQQRIQLDDLSAQVANLRSENDSLNRRLALQREDYEAQLSDLLESQKYFRDQVEKSEVVLDHADGHVTFVDYSNRRIRTNITRSMGARPQMILSVFDADAPGLPSDRPKARIKLLQVNERDSVAAIEEQFDKSNPLRAGDQVYSATWSPNRPQRFALIGKIDINRDGVDDRDDLIRLIEAAGGVVDYDLPPPGVGQEQGELHARIIYYIIDERDPIRSPSNDQDIAELTQAEQQFAQTQSNVIEQARKLGLRPLPIERLLASLGYSYGMLIPGKLEASNEQAIRNLLNPQGVASPLPGSEEFERRRQEAEQGLPTNVPF